MSSSPDLLQRMWAKAEHVSLPIRTTELRRLCASSKSHERLLGLLLTRRQIKRAGCRLDYYRIAVPLIEDRNNDCRWQSFIIVGEFIQRRPELVWPLVRKYGPSPSPDMRAAVATVLLEHLLEYHYQWTMRRVRRAVPRYGARFLDTLSQCWKFGQALDAFRGLPPDATWLDAIAAPLRPPRAAA